MLHREICDFPDHRRPAHGESCSGLVSGIGLAAGVILVVHIADYAHPGEPEIRESNTPPELIVISDISISPVTKYLTVVGKIANNSERKLDEVRARVELIQGTKVLFECSEAISLLPGPGKTSHLQLECRDIDRGFIPDGVSPRVRVSYVKAR